MQSTANAVRCRAYHAANAETINARKKVYRAANARKIKSRTKAYREGNPEKCNTLKQKSQGLMRRYGITLAQRDEMVKAQNGLCAICEGSMEGKRNMHVDHCHTTKKVRGMLCLECNIGLGKFKDDPELMLKAIAYLRN